MTKPIASGVWVDFEGRRVNLKELCKEKGEDYSTIYHRWRYRGRKKNADDLFKMKDTNRYVTCDGERITCVDLAKKLQVSRTFINRLIDKHGDNLKKEHIKINRKIQKLTTGTRRGVKAPESTIAMSVSIKQPVDDRSPGWAERLHFPNAGANGFSKHRATSGVGSHCELPHTTATP